MTHTKLITLRQAQDTANIENWQDISSFLSSIRSTEPPTDRNKSLYEDFSSGIAFITFDYGIDGVSIEIQKYAKSLEILFQEKNGKPVPLYFIGGDFHDKADTVLSPEWKRFQIPNINGWSKWDNGKWFSKLFYEDMPTNSTVSNKMAKIIWQQAVSFSNKLASYLVENNISLLIPVNICSNPGNPAATLAVVMVTEALGTFVISSNHDYYWEGGKAERPPDEDPGPRDHFFKNHKNPAFFKLFESLFPWNGSKWLQVNINEPQSETLITKSAFSKNKVFELESCISDEFLREYDYKDILSVRQKMAYILSDGFPVIKTKQIDEHFANLNHWMKNQHPIVCCNRKNTILDLTKKGTIYCLQPTRVIGRKRIYKDLEILTALLKHYKLDNAFKEGKVNQLILHITGPVPIEHQKDLEIVLNAYRKLCIEIKPEIADKVFLAFSVGTEDHTSFKQNKLKKLCIEDIYRLADIILFPSETEGRGLPIIESGASGIPIVCSRYYPEKVFDAVIGTELDEQTQIRYILFPENNIFSDELLDEVSEVLLNKEHRKKYSEHNRKAVKQRYGIKMLVDKFDHFIKVFQNNLI